MMNSLLQQTKRAARLSATGYTVAEIVENTKRFHAAMPTAEQFADRLTRSVAARSS
jgi:hypothetical protein